jgi:hypothetical protein
VRFVDYRTMSDRDILNLGDAGGAHSGRTREVLLTLPLPLSDNWSGTLRVGRVHVTVTVPNE